MNDLFGLSMTYVMIALLIIMGVALSVVGWVVLRNRVMFYVGVRNIPRRRAQTVLIIIGLMLSTLIISTAFSIGDTVNYSITNQAYDRLHSIDETVQASTGGTEGHDDPFDASQSAISAKPIPYATAQRLAAQARAIPGVDGAVPLIRGIVPVSNPRAGQTEPTVILVGVDSSRLDGFTSDIQTTGGADVSPASLAADEVYVNALAADKLAIVKGDQITIYVGGQPNVFTVKDIVQSRVLTGALLGIGSGMVMDLPRAQELLGRPAEVDLLAVSNEGGVRAGLEDSSAVKKQLDAQLAGTPWRASATKQDVVDTAAQVSSFFTTFFVVLGLFSIAAGMLLIFLIFVMLAAERKMEMGMIRAVGTKRSHLVQMFISEGMAYNTAAAAVGAALGVGVSVIMVRIMAALFAGFDLNIAFHVSPRSLIVSYSLGVVLTFLTVTFSSWRIGNLNIVSAIRDSADPMVLRTRPIWYSPLSIFRYAKWLTLKPSRWMQWFGGLGLFVLTAIIGAITVGLFMVAFGIYGSSALASVAAVLLGVLGVLLGIGAVVMAGIAFNYLFQAGAIAVVLGVAGVILGLSIGRMAPYAGGVTLIALGVAVSLTNLRLPARPVFTAMGVGLLVFWLLIAGSVIPPRLSGGVEMFFLSGLAMVLSSTFVLVYNADLMLNALLLLGNRFSSIIPAVRTAVAYPLANKFRTGMTVAMISLVMFALVMISTMNSNFSRLFLGNEALGGYDVNITENASNPITDVKGALQAGGFDASMITEADTVGVANALVSETRVQPLPGTPESDAKFNRYTILRPDAGFAQNTGVTLQARATGYASDADVWRAMATEPDVAVVDANAVGGDGGPGGGGFTVDQLKSTTTTFAPIRLQVRSGADATSVRTVRLIGVISLKGSLLYTGLWVAPPAFDATFGKPEYSNHLLKLTPGTNAKEAARGIEKTLLNQGAQADSLRQVVDDARAQNQGFLYLIQGFMGIGLFVGIAAVGVIAFRTVVERRQQIGMLRAIGYTRGAVALSFIMESSFITLLGVLSGIGLALLLAYQLLNADEFAGNAKVQFYIPWLQIIAIGGFAFIASLLMTIIPSRQASSIPIAEALRYE